MSVDESDKRKKMMCRWPVDAAASSFSWCPSMSDWERTRRTLEVYQKEFFKDSKNCKKKKKMSTKKKKEICCCLTPLWWNETCSHTCLVFLRGKRTSLYYLVILEFWISSSSSSSQRLIGLLRCFECGAATVGRLSPFMFSDSRTW